MLDRTNLDADLVEFLGGKRILPDVNVLLIALLAEESASAFVLAHCREAVLLLSEHVRDTARGVLDRKAPHLLGDYADSILQVLRDYRTEDVSSRAPSSLPAHASALGAEDCQVLADALTFDADILFSLDSDFLESEFRSVVGLEIRGPGELMWPRPLRKGEVIDFGRESWTFLGWYIPEYWASDFFDQPSQDSVFYIFEVADHVACYYEAHRGRYVLEWDTGLGARGRLQLSQEVERGSQNFVFVSVTEDHLMLFVNGETRERDVRLGPIPRHTRVHPFNDVNGEHQISASVQFRALPRGLSEGRLRRHWRASTLWLTDDEIELDELLGPLLEYG